MVGLSGNIGKLSLMSDPSQYNLPPITTPLPAIKMDPQKSPPPPSSSSHYDTTTGYSGM
jgi:hypothetical protein